MRAVNDPPFDHYDEPAADGSYVPRPIVDKYHKKARDEMTARMYKIHPGVDFMKITKQESRFALVDGMADIMRAADPTYDVS